MVGLLKKNNAPTPKYDTNFIVQTNTSENDFTIKSLHLKHHSAQRL